jgi:ATP-dependent 26S proteasome regulatory subunit
LASQTEGFSGSDLRMMVKEAILSALMDKRQSIVKGDIEKGIRMVKNRDAIRHLNWL